LRWNQRVNPHPVSGEDELQTVTVYYLWDGEHIVPNPAGEYFIADRLKTLKMRLQSELRSEQAG